MPRHLKKYHLRCFTFSLSSFLISFSYLKFREGGCLAHSLMAAESEGWDQSLGPLSLLMKRWPLLEIKRCFDLSHNGLETAARGGVGVGICILYCTFLLGDDSLKFQS